MRRKDGLYINESIVVRVYVINSWWNKEGRERMTAWMMMRILVLEFVVIITIVDNKIY